MYHLLVPIDADEDHVRAQLDAIEGLLEAGEAVRADLLYVYEEIDSPADEAGKAYIREINENIEDLQGVPDTVDLAAETLRNVGIETAVHDVSGDPASAIVEVAAEFDVDAVVVGARRRSPIGKVLFGSVAQAVLLESEQPVFVTAT